MSPRDALVLAGPRVDHGVDRTWMFYVLLALITWGGIFFVKGLFHIAF